MYSYEFIVSGIYIIQNGKISIESEGLYRVGRIFSKKLIQYLNYYLKE